MKFENAIVLMTAAISFSIASCEKKSAADVGHDIKNAIKSGENRLTLKGRWQADCSVESIIPNFKSGQEELQFNEDGTFEKRHYFFSDDQCKSPSIVREERGTVKFPDANDVKTESSKIDFLFETVSVAADNDSASKLLSTMGYCNNTYGVRQQVDLTKRSQETDGTLQCPGIKKVPRNGYDTIKIVNGKILLAGDADEQDAAQRPLFTENSGKLFTQK